MSEEAEELEQQPEQEAEEVPEPKNFLKPEQILEGISMIQRTPGIFRTP